MNKAMFHIFTKDNFFDYGKPKYVIYPNIPEKYQEGYTKELVDMNVYIFSLIKEKTSRSIIILERMRNYSWLLDLEARNALNKFLDSLNNIYPSFIDFLGKNPIVDADCISSNDECSHAFVYYEESARFTKEALEDFKEVFSCKIKKYRNECFEFLIDTSLSKSEQRSISKKINVFLEICAGFCSEDIYEKYIDETPFFKKENIIIFLIFITHYSF